MLPEVISIARLDGIKNETTENTSRPLERDLSSKHDGREWTELTDAESREGLKKSQFDYLEYKKPRIHESCAVEGLTPASKATRLDCNEGHRALPEAELKKFEGPVAPCTMSKEKTYYRVVGADNVPLSDYWTEKPPDKETYRAQLAIQHNWNGNHGIVEFRPAGDIDGWRGATAAVDASDGKGHLPGGGEQIWVDKEDIRRTGGKCRIRSFD
jgi:hypothetical protein